MSSRTRVRASLRTALIHQLNLISTDPVNHFPRNNQSGFRVNNAYFVRFRTTDGRTRARQARILPTSGREFPNHLAGRAPTETSARFQMVSRLLESSGVCNGTAFEGHVD